MLLSCEMTHSSWLLIPECQGLHSWHFCSDNIKSALVHSSDISHSNGIYIFAASDFFFCLLLFYSFYLYSWLRYLCLLFLHWPWKFAFAPHPACPSCCTGTFISCLPLTITMACSESYLDLSSLNRWIFFLRQFSQCFLSLTVVSQVLFQISWYWICSLHWSCILTVYAPVQIFKSKHSLQFSLEKFPFSMLQ